LIIFDIDDVLLDWSKSFDIFLRNEKDYIGEPVQTSTKRIPEILNTTPDEANKIMLEHNESCYFKHMDIKGDSNLIIDFNYSEPIIGITSCGITDTIIKARLENIRAKFGMKITKIIHLELHQNKFEVLTRFNKIYKNVYYLDDNIRNIEYGDSIGINSFVYLTKFNQNLIKDTIKYVYNMK